MSNVNKQGVFEATNFTEYTLNCKYDGTVHVEPDGSQWLHIFHHNNPASNLFSSSNDFENGCYLSEDMWFNMNVCKNLSQWEFIYAQKSTSDSDLIKYRWIQTKSPYEAVYSDVTASSVTRITTTGYTNGIYGGLYALKSNAYMVIANASNGNWYGATGCWTAYQSGIPGYPQSTITSGCADIYVRIDNGSLSTTDTQFKVFD